MAQLYFKYPASVTNMEIRIDDPDRAAVIARQAEAVLGPKLRVLTWQQSNGPFFNALQVERNVMFLILTLIILVAVLNVISGLIMLVKDKGRDIAILRTMGATRGMIMRVFLMAGASVGVIGTLVGFGLGLVFCDNIENIRQFLQRLIGTELFSPEVYFLTQIRQDELGRDPGCRTDGAGAVVYRDALPVLARGPHDPVEALRYE